MSSAILAKLIVGSTPRLADEILEAADDLLPNLDM
jgi:hypothetical protein